MQNPKRDTVLLNFKSHVARVFVAHSVIEMEPVLLRQAALTLASVEMELDATRALTLLQRVRGGRPQIRPNTADGSPKRDILSCCSCSLSLTNDHHPCGSACDAKWIGL